MLETWAIVVVDEDAATARFIQEALNTVPGYGAVTIDDGHAAVEVIAAVRADLVLIDLDQSRIDGLRLHERLRDCIATAGVRVLFFASPEHAPTPARRGATRFLRKPFVATELLAEVRVALSEGPPRYAPVASA